MSMLALFETCLDLLNLFIKFVFNLRSGLMVFGLKIIDGLMIFGLKFFELILKV